MQAHYLSADYFRVVSDLSKFLTGDQWLPYAELTKSDLTNHYINASALKVWEE